MSKDGCPNNKRFIILVDTLGNLCLRDAESKLKANDLKYLQMESLMNLGSDNSAASVMFMDG